MPWRNCSLRSASSPALSRSHFWSRRRARAGIGAARPDRRDQRAAAAAAAQRRRDLAATVSIPDQKAANLEHPAGRNWQNFHTVTLKWIGGIAILGMLALLVLFYLWRGTMRIEGGRSGRTMLRFNAFERFVHWMTATSFVMLGITGLNITFGRALLLPWMGPDAFSAWSEWAKYFAQLSQLRLHHRRRADVPDVDRAELPECGRRTNGSSCGGGMGRAISTRRRASSTPGRSRFLARRARRRRHGHQRLYADVPLLRRRTSATWSSPRSSTASSPCCSSR